MPPPLTGRALIDAFACLSDGCLTSLCRVHRAKSRTERPRKTKIGTGVAHVTRDSDTTFKVKRSRSPLYSPWPLLTRYASGSCSGERGNVLGVGIKLLVRCGVLGEARRFGAHRGRRGAGAYRGGRPPTLMNGIHFLLC